MDNNVGVTLELENVAKRGQKNHAFGTHKIDFYFYLLAVIIPCRFVLGFFSRKRTLRAPQYLLLIWSIISVYAFDLCEFTLICIVSVRLNSLTVLSVCAHLCIVEKKSHFLKKYFVLGAICFRSAYFSLPSPIHMEIYVRMSLFRLIEVHYC